jgi:UDP-glucose 4-epimerase
MTKGATRKSKVLIVGGSGFMGSHVADALSEQGYDVTIYDHSPSPYLRSDQKMITASINDIGALTEAFENTDYAYYFAGIADIGEAKANPQLTIEVNVMGVTRVLEVAVRASLRRFVYASTMYVYSAHGSFYRASKQAAEAIVEAYCENSDTDYTFLRYGSLYGPRAQNWNGLKKYVRSIIENQHIDYVGNGSERREYIHVTDAAMLSTKILESPFSNKAVIITGQQMLDSKTLIKMIFEIAGIKESAHYDATAVNNEHYQITPYRFQPQAAIKLVPDLFVDIGQGILDLITEASQEFDTKYRH